MRVPPGCPAPTAAPVPPQSMPHFTPHLTPLLSPCSRTMGYLALGQDWGRTTYRLPSVQGAQTPPKLRPGVRRPCVTHHPAQ